METELSILMARIVALIYIPIGIGLLTGQIKAKAMIKSYKDSAAFTLFVGIFAVIAGLLLVHYHNLWVKDWQVLITLIGWIAVIEGVLFIAFPKTLLSYSERMSKNMTFWNWFALGFGLLFGYFGFLA